MRRSGVGGGGGVHSWRRSGGGGQSWRRKQLKRMTEWKRMPEFEGGRRSGGGGGEKEEMMEKMCGGGRREVGRDKAKGWLAISNFK
jgi:hypothetical protein